MDLCARNIILDDGGAGKYFCQGVSRKFFLSVPYQSLGSSFKQGMAARAATMLS